MKRYFIGLYFRLGFGNREWCEITANSRLEAEAFAEEWASRYPIQPETIQILE